MTKSIKKAYFKQIVDAVTNLLDVYEEQALKLAGQNRPLKVATKSPNRLAEARKIIGAVAVKNNNKAKKAKSAKAVKAVAKKARKSTQAAMKPCPVTGVLNKHRRFSYLMPEVRTPENLAKFKGAAKAAAKASV